MYNTKKNMLAVWILTPNGTQLADKIFQNLPDVCVYASQNIEATTTEYQTFQNLAERIKQKFHQYTGHIFIMATGIVVRTIAPLIQSKTKDPAVVVVDDLGNNAISLLSGHLGGANELTHRVAQIIGANPVITTATDINEVPAIDLLAKERNFFIENPRAIKTVNMALLRREKIFVYDPYNFLRNSLPGSQTLTPVELKKHFKNKNQSTGIETFAYVYVDDAIVDLPSHVLILRPASLTAGIGCNRNTGAEEIQTLLTDVLSKQCLASSSLKCMASIDIKADESGIIMTAENLGLPLTFFSKQELNQVKNIRNPSKVVEKHVGVKSVCEAAAILAARGGTLIVAKQSTKNVTVAIARINFSSSE